VAPAPAIHQPRANEEGSPGSQSSHHHDATQDLRESETSRAVVRGVNMGVVGAGSDTPCDGMAVCESKRHAWNERVCLSFAPCCQQHGTPCHGGGGIMHPGKPSSQAAHKQPHYCRMDSLPACSETQALTA